MKKSMKSGLKALTLSAFFAAMFLVGCEQPMSSVVGTDDAAASYGKNSSELLGGDQRDGKPKQDFGAIFRKLDLTADQQAAIEVLKRQHHECEKSAMDALKASERAIMESFKAQRKAIEEAVKAGTKTREEAHAEMRALDAAQKEALKNNPDRATAEAAVKACHDTFIAGVRALLTAEQLELFNAWLENPTRKDDGKGDDKGGDRDRDKRGDKGDDKGGDRDRDKRGDKGDDKGGDKDGKRDHSRDGIYKMLQLTAEQLAAVDALQQQRRDCETPHLEALKTAERTLAQSFEAERRAIHEAVKAGSITREEANTQMRDVEMRQKEAMKNNPEIAAAHAALKACHDTFNAGVRALLTPEQQAIWDRLMNSTEKPGNDKGDRKGDDRRRRGRH